MTEVPKQSLVNAVFSLLFLSSAACSPARAPLQVPQPVPCPDGCCSDRYFPRGVGDSPAEAPLPQPVEEAIRCGYSRQLMEMGEPPLRGTESGTREVYRFFWQPACEKPMVVRVEKLGDRYLAVRTELAPSQIKGHRGQVTAHEQKTIDPGTWKSLTTNLGAAGFWSLPLHDRTEPVMTDGEHLLVEGVAPGRYHVVKRGNQHAMALAEVLFRFLSQATWPPARKSGC